MQQVRAVVCRQTEAETRPAGRQHQPTRERERRMKRFKSPEHAQRFLEVQGIMAAHFRPKRHLLNARRFIVPRGNDASGLASSEAVCRSVTPGDSLARDFFHGNRTVRVSWHATRNVTLPMPRVTGYDVLQVMKDDAALRDIPAVVFSSSGLDRGKALCLALGARDFVTKPMDFDQFVDVLRNTCKLV
jgi:hypothetical protein